MKFPGFGLFSVIVAIILCICGCDASSQEDSSSVQDTQVRKISVNVLVIGDKTLGPVIQRQFGSRRNGEATLTEMAWEEFASSNFAAAAENDILVYPARRLGELASRGLLVPITDNNARLENNWNRSLLFSDRDHAVSWGGEHVAMSMGQSHWVMLYRTEWLEATESEIPVTWNDFEKLTLAIADLDSTELPKRIAIPLKDHWASYSLMARVASAISTSRKVLQLFRCCVNDTTHR